MNKKKIIAILIIIVLVILSGVGISYLSNKYSDISVLSIRKEYNLVLNSKDESIDIPLYVSRKNSFITEKDALDKTYIKNDYYKILVNIYEISYSQKIEYLDETYYEYIFKLKINSISDFCEPVFINDAKIELNYTNEEKLIFSLGNMNLYFNSSEEKSDLIFIKLEAVTNIIGDSETIVGLNMRIYNNTFNPITLNSLELKNKFYEYDYMNYKLGLLSYNTNLKTEYEDYSYTAFKVDNGDMNLDIGSKEYVDIFVPIIYTNGIKVIDRIPVYVSYLSENNACEYIQDDFQFMKSDDFLNNNGIEKYEYSYFESK